MRRPLLTELSSILISLILALTIWVVAMQEQNPMFQDRFPQAIPIQVVNKGEGLVIVWGFDEEVTLLVRAPQKVWPNLDEDSFNAYIDLANLGVGLHEVPVEVQPDDRSVRVVEKEPGMVSLVLDTQNEKRLRVQVNILGDIPVGYDYETPEVTPSQVVVRGPRSLVEQVTRVVVDLPLRGEKSTIEQPLAPTPQDRIGGIVDGVEVTPSTVTVRLPIEQRLGYKELSVRAVTEGSVAAGYWISNISVTPSTVTVFGNPQVVGEIPGYLETEPVDVEGATGDLMRRVGLVVPPDVALLDIQNVIVRVEISPVFGGQTIKLEPVLQGLSQELAATVSPDIVEVILAGPLPDLAALEPGDVQVVLDLRGLKPGVYKISPEVIKPDSLQVQSIVPDQVEVVIAES